MSNSHLKLKMFKIQISVLKLPLICSFHSYHYPSHWKLYPCICSGKNLYPGIPSFFPPYPNHQQILSVLHSKYLQNSAISLTSSLLPSWPKLPSSLTWVIVVTSLSGLSAYDLAPVVCSQQSIILFSLNFLS